MDKIVVVYLHHRIKIPVKQNKTKQNKQEHTTDNTDQGG